MRTGLGFSCDRVATAGLALLAMAVVVGCHRDPDLTAPAPSTSSSARAPVPSASAPPGPQLPPEPPAPAADLAAEVPKFEAELAADPAYATIWDPQHADDLTLLLSGVSEALSDGGFTGEIRTQLPKRKLKQAALDLYLVHARLNQFPQDFTDKLRAYLSTIRPQINLGVWAPFQAGQVPHDFAALALWMNRDQPSYVRALLAARRGGPIHWMVQSKPPLRPYLSTEIGALEWLSILTQLTPDEAQHLSDLNVDAETLKVPAATLLSTYKANEVRGDNAYKGKTLLISGLIASIEKDFTNAIIVKVGTGADFETPTAWCYVVDADAKSAAALSKGDHISIRGRVEGLTLGEVIVRDAQIVP